MECPKILEKKKHWAKLPSWSIPKKFFTYLTVRCALSSFFFSCHLMFFPQDAFPQNACLLSIITQLILYKLYVGVHECVCTHAHVHDRWSMYIRVGELIRCTHKERYVKKRFLNVGRLDWFLNSVYFVCLFFSSLFTKSPSTSMTFCYYNPIIPVPPVLIFILWQEEEPWSNCGSLVSSKRPHMTFPIPYCCVFQSLRYTECLHISCFPLCFGMHHPLSSNTLSGQSQIQFYLLMPGAAFCLWFAQQC